MSRPVSWLPRLHEIRQTVAHSVRSHYDRKDIERLFELQPRAAQKLLEMLPAIAIGTARLVDREVLSSFLNEVHQASDSTALLQQLRGNKPGMNRRRTRSLVRRDAEPAALASLPSNICLSCGTLSVHFETVEELAQAMYTLARILQDDSDAFAAAFEPVHEVVSQSDEPNDSQAMFGELAALETNRLLLSNLSDTSRR